MNIFFTNYSPVICAQDHCDKHVVKMVLETAQILSVAAQACAGQPIKGLYAPTHAHHPCVLWAQKSRAHFDWLARLGIALSEEYSFRFHREHASSKVVLLARKYGIHVPDRIAQCPPPRAMPLQFNSVTLTTEAYRLYIAGHKSHFAKWARGREEPWWWQQALQKVQKLALARNVENNSSAHELAPLEPQLLF